MKMFAIKDVKAEAFNIPFSQPTFGVAERAFKEALSDSNNPMSKHREDLSLYYIGSFEAETGVITPLAQPELVCLAE